VTDDKDIAEAAVDCGIIPAGLTALEWSAKASKSRDSTAVTPEKETTMDVDLEPEEEESQAELELREVGIQILPSRSYLTLPNRPCLPSWPQLGSQIPNFHAKSSSETSSQRNQPYPP
jgi:hypothetical protein